jgi:hypothetical protein
VLADKKTTTIRDKAWPIGVPIMLFEWSGRAYRSKQIDVSPVIALDCWKIYITHKEDGGMIYASGRVTTDLIHETEGFVSRADMDEWFRPLVKPGKTIKQTLMLFRRLNGKTSL